MEKNTILNIRNIYPLVVKAIKDVGDKFNMNKGIILNESDMKCQIYKGLSSIVDENMDTFDTGIIGSPLHSELAFYNPNELNYANMPVDLVILQPSKLSIKKDPSFRLENGRITNGLPDKCYRALGDFIIIELKFCKYKNGITENFTKGVINDIRKIKKIIEFNVENNIKGISVIFNKTNRVCTEFNNEVLNKDYSKIEIIYSTSNFVI